MVLTVRVITPDKTVWDNTVQEVVLPSTSGQLGILSGHAPLLTALDTGVMRIRTDKEWQNVAIMGGFAEVEQDEVKVLVNFAEVGETIDKEEAKREYNTAQAKLEEVNKGNEHLEKIKASNALKRAKARFNASGGIS
ncbi:ATP synthase F1 subunit epsilon [Candidatus Atelocyanobacterium thalassae]|uniref:ATP synthase epsilon chain n=2 Tax=Candidatus Atelocyanobacterium thalassae TaxID=713887 RepID=A0A086CFH4_9CHRO|nr:ATP synthase F1 subunit epsilon [Candidatus Atelocyanobacterium thalassa]KFF40938.1 MAG: ATP synthase F1 subcomplex epsilon subunit [Candidatus Atelocyanobacterium thalassa isolate SIO64986]BDA39707.1 ATP synthase epsilon chain [cyanobacterium endosymbiont of Braarudosphaera bigelowii]